MLQPHTCFVAAILCTRSYVHCTCTRSKRLACRQRKKAFARFILLNLGAPPPLCVARTVRSDSHLGFSTRPDRISSRVMNFKIFSGLGLFGLRFELGLFEIERRGHTGTKKGRPMYIAKIRGKKEEEERRKCGRGYYCTHVNRVISERLYLAYPYTYVNLTPN